MSNDRETANHSIHHPSGGVEGNDAIGGVGNPISQSVSLDKHFFDEVICHLFQHSFGYQIAWVYGDPIHQSESYNRVDVSVELIQHPVDDRFVSCDDILNLTLTY